jgi:hypothetical protein
MIRRQAGIWTVLALCVSFMALSSFSEGFIRKNAEHDCCGEGCPICLQIQWAQDFSRQLRYTPFPIPLPLSALLFSILVLKPVPFNLVPVSSVTLKVKMNR